MLGTASRQQKSLLDRRLQHLSAFLGINTGASGIHRKAHNISFKAFVKSRRAQLLAVSAAPVNRPPHSISSHRKAAAAAAAASAAQSSSGVMVEKRVAIKNAKGEQMIGILVDAGSEDIAILCHGLGDHKDGFLLPKMAEALAQKGLSSLRFDFPGNGESDGTFKYANMIEEKEDIRAAVEYLRAQCRKVSGLVGHSKGGTGVILYAAAYDDIPLVVNIAGRFDNMKGITERFGDDIFEYLEKHGQMEITWPSSDPSSGGKRTWMLTNQDMINRRKLLMDPHARAIKQSHVLNIHGTADETIQYQDAISFHEQIAKSDLVLVDGADHNFQKSHHADYLIKHVVHFLLTGTVLEDAKA